MATKTTEDALVKELTALYTAIGAAQKAINVVYELLPQIVDGLPVEKADTSVENSKLDAALELITKMAADAEKRDRELAEKKDPYSAFNGMMGPEKKIRGLGPQASAYLRG